MLMGYDKIIQPHYFKVRRVSLDKILQDTKSLKMATSFHTYKILGRPCRRKGPPQICRLNHLRRRLGTGPLADASLVVCRNPLTTDLNFSKKNEDDNRHYLDQWEMSGRSIKTDHTFAANTDGSALVIAFCSINHLRGKAHVEASVLRTTQQFALVAA
jgi:hypothetical protein